MCFQSNPDTKDAEESKSSPSKTSPFFIMVDVAVKEFTEILLLQM